MIRYVAIDMLPDAATLNGVLRERHSKKECNVIAPTCYYFHPQNRSEMAAS